MSQSQHLSQGSGTYTFSSSPRALGSKKKYREPVQNEEAKTPTYNIMTDRRVKRGTTVTPTPTNQTLLMRKEEERLQREKERLRKQREKLKQKQDTSTREPSPEPVSGRQRMKSDFKIMYCRHGNSN